jgi:hypothetical protein
VSDGRCLSSRRGGPVPPRWISRDHGVTRRAGSLSLVVGPHPLRPIAGIGTLKVGRECERRNHPFVRGPSGRVNKRKLLQKLLVSPKKKRDSTTSAVSLKRLASGSRVSPGVTISSRIPAVPELLNLQEVSGEAQLYQIRQFLRLVERHNLPLGDSG